MKNKSEIPKTIDELLGINCGSIKISVPACLEYTVEDYENCAEMLIESRIINEIREFKQKHPNEDSMHIQPSQIRIALLKRTLSRILMKYNIDIDQIDLLIFKSMLNNSINPNKSSKK